MQCGPYELLDLLGKGAMGSVHRARHGVTGGVVALKLVTPGDPRKAKRLLREAELAGRLDHPGIVGVLDAGQHGEVVFVAFELVGDARPLDEVLRGLPLVGRVALLRDVARALGHAHARGVTHRDVKAENVLVDLMGRARVTDFGIGTAEGLERLTLSGALIGTPWTMAPEQARSERARIGPPTDVWALGVLLHEALVGEHPLFGKTPPMSLVEALGALSRPAARGPRDVDPQVPASLDAVVRRALAPEPEERYADGEAMSKALDAALRSLARPRRGRRRAWALVAAAAGLVALGVPGVAASWRFSKARAARDEGLRLLSASDPVGAVAALRSAEALSPGVVPEGVFGQALVSVARDALARGDLAAADRALVGASGAPGSAALSFELALARGDLEAAARALPAGDRGASRRLALALVEQARAGAFTAPATAARDLAAALSLDPEVEAREAALFVGYAFADVPDDGPLQAALALAPDDVATEAWIERAIAPRAPHRGTEALERALERAASPVQRGEVLVHLDRLQAAIDTLQPHIDDPALAAGARAWLVVARGEQLHQRPGGLTDSDRRDLVRAWDDVIARDPTLVEPWSSRALRRAELGDSGALEDAARACALRPAPLAARAWQRVGYVNLLFGRWAEAARLLGRALELEDGLFEARKQRGIARLRAGDPRGALEDLQRVERESPGNFEVCLGLVDASVALGEPSGVRALVDRAVAVDPRPIREAWAAAALADTGDLVLAEGRLTTVLASVGDEDPRYLLRCRARVRVELGDQRGALADAEALVVLAPNDAIAHTSVALARLAAGDVTGGRAALEGARRARAQPSEDDLAWLHVAEAWYQLVSDGDLARARAVLDAALTAARPPWGLALAVRALVRRAQGDLDGAQEDARALLSRLALAPPDAWPVRTARDVLAQRR